MVYLIRSDAFGAHNRKKAYHLNSDDDTLVDWARPILMRVQEGGNYEELVDPRLGDNYDHNEMLHMVACAGACIRHSRSRTS